MREIKAPLLKKLADAERADDLLHLWLHPHHRIIVEMIPVIVRHEQHIEFRDIRGRIDIAPAKRAVDEKDRRTVCRKYGIDENTAPADLQIERRMPHPYHNIPLARNRVQIRFIAWDGLLRHTPVIAAEEHAIERLDPVRLLLVRQILRHHLDRLKANELPVHIMRRRLDPLKARSRRRTPELLLSHKEPGAAGKRTDPRQRTKNKIPSFHKIPLLNIKYSGPRHKRIIPCCPTS